jgi:predicted Ser/Thr protein kinase
MALSPGTRLGSYEILSPIGAGGMGEVYRARDLKLGRDVAVKVLPPELAADTQRRRRFEQEARAASALNHPSVIHVYDVGSTDDTTWIAMELVEGRTLRDVAGSGPVSAKKLLELAIPLADGLARAHEAGIVHRDLKPDNVMVSKEGHVRILDFGLAKLVEPGGDVSELSTSPHITQAGAVVGTVSYMSPEQAAGRSVDFRSDQFSLGTILYELASGRKPFQRPTGTETLTAILREPAPPLAPLAPRMPAPLRWMIEERCLAKEPGERYASTRDLLRELQGLRDHLSDASATGLTAAATAPGRSWLRPLLGLTAAALVGAGLHAMLGPRAEREFPTLRRVSFRRGSIPQARFAPDGQTIIYAATFGSRPEVLSARVDSPESRSFGLEQAGLYAVASNGEMAVSLRHHPISGWERSGTLARVALGGGAPREILEDVLDADWSPDGRELAVVRDIGGRRRLEFPIDKVLYETAGYISHIRVSPRGDHVAFLDHPIRGDNAGMVAIVDLSGRRTTLARDFLTTDGLAWTASGREIWFGGARAGVKNELRAVTLEGKERLVWREAGPVALRDVSRDGRVLMARQSQAREMSGLLPGDAAERDLSWLDWSYPVDLSEDAQTLLFEEEGEGAGKAYAVYVRTADGSAAVRLGEGGALALAPDGRSALGLSGNALTILPIGPGMARKLALGDLICQFAEFFPDGQRILMVANAPDRPAHLYILDASGGAPRVVDPDGPGLSVEYAARRLSPDGRWVAAAGPDRRTALYPTAGGAARAIPGIAPGEIVVRWTGDGRGLYVYRPGIVSKVEVLDLASGRRTPWKTLAPADPAGVLTVRPVLVSPDGRWYVYSYTRQTEDLYLAEGLR